MISSAAIRYLCIKAALLCATILLAQHSISATFTLPSELFAHNIFNFSKRIISAEPVLGRFTEPCEPSETSASTSTLNHHHQCGPNTLCYQAKCLCLLGFVPNSNGDGCVQYSCAREDDCERFPGTICSFDLNICVCDDVLDWNHQTCTPFFSESFKRIALIVIAVVLIVIACSMAIVWYMRRTEMRQQNGGLTCPKVAGQPILLEQTTGHTQFGYHAGNYPPPPPGFATVSNGH